MNFGNYILVGIPVMSFFAFGSTTRQSEAKDFDSIKWVYPRCFITSEDKPKEKGFGRIMIPDAYGLNLMCIFAILNLRYNEQNYF